MRVWFSTGFMCAVCFLGVPVQAQVFVIPSTKPAVKQPVHTQPHQEDRQAEAQPQPQTALVSEPRKILVLDVRSSVLNKEQRVLLSSVAADAAVLAMQQKNLSFTVVTESDLRELLNVEEKRQAMGCEGESCLAELEKSLHARYVLTTRVGKLGKMFMMGVELQDTEKGGAIARQNASVATVEAIPRVLKEKVAILLSDVVIAPPITPLITGVPDVHPSQVPSPEPKELAEENKEQVAGPQEVTQESSQPLSAVEVQQNLNNAIEETTEQLPTATTVLWSVSGGLVLSAGVLVSLLGLAPAGLYYAQRTMLQSNANTTLYGWAQDSRNLYNNTTRYIAMGGGALVVLGVGLLVVGWILPTEDTQADEVSP